MNHLNHLVLVGSFLTALAGPVTAASQADPVDPHAGHMAMSAQVPEAANPHAHHHAATAPDSSPLGPREEAFNTVLVASSPGNGAMLGRSPPMLSLTFPTAMTIRQIVLTNAAGQRVPVAAALPAAAVNSFSSPLVELDGGAYMLRWRGFDGARETGGSLSFAVN